MSDLDPDELRDAADLLDDRSRSGKVLTQDELHNLSAQLEVAADRIERYEKALRDIAEERESIRVYVEGEWSPKPEAMKRCAKAALEPTND